MIILPNSLSLIASIRLDARRSRRDFADREISLDQISAVLFAAQGRLLGEEKRLVPSAGARYPLEIRLAVRRVQSLLPGVFRYIVKDHALEPIWSDNRLQAMSPDLHLHEAKNRALDIGETKSDLFLEIVAATFEAPWVENAAAAVFISGVFDRTTGPYADQPPPGRAERYVWLEAGHAAQNAALAAASLGLATVFIGGFHDEAMARVFRLEDGERPIGLMPIGPPA